MKRKTGALLLAGMIMTTVAVVMAWDKTDLDIDQGRYGIAIAVVRANFDYEGHCIASEHSHDGGFKPGYTPPSGWYFRYRYTKYRDWKWGYAYTKRWTYIYDNGNKRKETDYAYASVS